VAESPHPTIADVARAAGVSKGLVSFALNGRPGVAPGTRKRILDAASRLGWTPSVRARSLSTGRAFACGLVIGRSPDVIAADPFFPSFIAGVEDAFAETGQVLVLAVATPGLDEERVYRTLATDRRVDGVVLTDLRAADERLGLIGELGLAAVTLGVPDVPSPFSSITVDDGAGIRQAVEHLASLGHRRVAHVAGPDRMLHGMRRRQAFEAAATEVGIGVEVVATDFSAAEGAAATAALLERDAPPTAIVYSNDQMAVAGLGVAQRRGVSVPDELSITGFDDTEIGRHVYPGLTSVATQARAWGEAAARTLLDAIAGAPAQHLTLPEPRLVVRGSTGSAPASVPGSAPADPDAPRHGTRRV
jgi:DNA-binding LacI/PurR family transcriptional regulator